MASAAGSSPWRNGGESPWCSSPFPPGSLWARALARAGDFDLLITGDMAGSTEKLLVQTYPLPDLEVLVVSHHGSRYSSDEDFLRAVTPETAVISVGDNRYGHPTEAALRRLQAAGVSIWRTDQQGSIRITVNGG